MKILKLVSQNIKKLKAIEIVPKGHVVIISGKSLSLSDFMGMVPPFS